MLIDMSIFQVQYSPSRTSKLGHPFIKPMYIAPTIFEGDEWMMQQQEVRYDNDGDLAAATPPQFAISSLNGAGSGTVHDVATARSFWWKGTRDEKVRLRGLSALISFCDGLPVS